MSNDDFDSKNNAPSEKTPDGVNGDYKVGYKKTPEQTRFKKGTSGNPSGKRAKELFAAEEDGAFATEIARQLREVHRVRDEKGRTVKQAGAALFARSVWASALKEDGASRRYLLSNLNINLFNLDREPDDSELEARKLRLMARMLTDPKADWDEFDRQCGKEKKSSKRKSPRKRRKEDPDADAELDQTSND